MEDPVSKSQKKRDAEYMRKIGIKLIELSNTKLASLPLTEQLYKAIVDAKSIKSHGAKRRQAQLIGKLMRSADFDAILAAYNQLEAEDSSVTASFHEVELWRDKLINGGKDSLTEFLDVYQTDVQQLRQLIKKAVEDQLKERNTGASTALFRYLRSCIK
ncbi:ribosome biogenesis factor YjgA [Legionella sp. km772]|uniref:ribosome biogenesis factor YjgA n=1 Tax=Legionella sp. km772 TaxID=2498111 RepID=UPI000F8F0D58|nr:ribosome biogenesis factor YjgA [Legionella sp. km772]RUR12716.1 ribosome-associated protein [Legionella sp. km772]